MVGLGPDIQSPGEKLYEAIAFQPPEAVAIKIEIMQSHLDNAYWEGEDVGRGSILVRILEHIERMEDVNRESMYDLINQLMNE